MPLMAHPKHGFESVPGGSEVAARLVAGWELCNDVMAYKRRVWGIGAPAADPVPVEVQPEPAKPRRGRPPKG